MRMHRAVFLAGCLTSLCASAALASTQGLSSIDDGFGARLTGSGDQGHIGHSYLCSDNDFGGLADISDGNPPRLTGSGHAPSHAMMDIAAADPNQDPDTNDAGAASSG